MKVLTGLNSLIATLLFIPAAYAGTFYVDADVGNDSNACTSEGSGNACATIAGALAIADDDSSWDDIIYVKNTTATYDEDVGVGTTPDIGTGESLRIIGYDSTPGDNPTGTNRPTVNGGNSRTNCFDIDQDGVLVANFICDDPSDDGIQANTGSSFVNVKVTSAVDGSGTSTNLYACELGNNSSNASVGNSADLRIVYSHDNSSTGIDDPVNCSKSISDTDGSAGLISTSETKYSDLTVYNPSGDGIFQSGNNSDNVDSWIEGCVIDTTGDDGIAASASTKSTLTLAYANISNTTGDDIDSTVNYFQWLGYTTAAPGFTDAANGDFTPGSNLQGKNKALNATGISGDGDFSDLGAIQHEDTGGGGTTSYTWVGS